MGGCANTLVCFRLLCVGGWLCVYTWLNMLLRALFASFCKFSILQGCVHPSCCDIGASLVSWVPVIICCKMQLFIPKSKLSCNNSKRQRWSVFLCIHALGLFVCKWVCMPIGNGNQRSCVLERLYKRSERKEWQAAERAACGGGWGPMQVPDFAPFLSIWNSILLSSAFRWGCREYSFYLIFKLGLGCVHVIRMSTLRYIYFAFTLWILYSKVHFQYEMNYTCSFFH